MKLLKKDFNGYTITFKPSNEGISKGFVDCLIDENFCKANGYSSKKELLYYLGASAEQIHNEEGLPEFARYWEDGRITSTEINL